MHAGFVFDDYQAVTLNGASVSALVFALNVNLKLPNLGVVSALLVIKDGNIVCERYQLGNDANSRWVSFSVAKSVTSMLIGAAIKDGYISSVDDKVTDYLPLLKNCSYDQATIRNLLRMASRVEWDEDYADKKSDINQADFATLSLYAYLCNKPRVAAPGEEFNYNTA